MTENKLIPQKVEGIPEGMIEIICIYADGKSNELIVNVSDIIKKSCITDALIDDVVGAIRNTLHSYRGDSFA